MNHRSTWNRGAQLFAVLLCGLMLKWYYSTVSVNQLRWILAPTTALVELVSGRQFEFEPYAGYLSSDRTFLIANSCAGLNFLLTAFLMLSLKKLWRGRSRNLAWRFIPISALVAYLATLAANTVRISTALWLRQMPVEFGGLSQNQLHRFEGIFIYFGFLVLLFMASEKLSLEVVSEKMSSKNGSALLGQSFSSLFRESLFPLLIYYTTTLGIPLVNGAYEKGRDFWEHSLFLLLTPLLVTVPLAAFRFFRAQAPFSRRLRAITRPENGS